MCLFKVALGYYDDESVEGFNIICNDLNRCYSNQLGKLRVKYMMRKLYLITSTKYCDMYTNGKENIS